jgi:hypothetical protein
MPLEKSGSRGARQRNIAEMIAGGHEPRQAVAASYSNQRKYARKGRSGRRSSR